jgi:putative transcriptional regulator
MLTKMKESRAKLELSQKDLADLVGVRRETIIRVEKGRFIPSLLLAKKIAHYLNSTIDEVFIFENKELIKK